MRPFVALRHVAFYSRERRNPSRWHAPLASRLVNRPCRESPIYLLTLRHFYLISRFTRGVTHHVSLCDLDVAIFLLAAIAAFLDAGELFIWKNSGDVSLVFSLLPTLSRFLFIYSCFLFLELSTSHLRGDRVFSGNLREITSREGRRALSFSFFFFHKSNCLFCLSKGG